MEALLTNDAIAKIRANEILNSIVLRIIEILYKSSCTIFLLEDNTHQTIKALYKGTFEAKPSEIVNITRYTVKTTDKNNEQVIVATAIEKAEISNIGNYEEETKSNPKSSEMAKDTETSSFTPIADLQMDMQAFVIKGVVNKEPKYKNYHNDRGSGTFYQFELNEDANSIEVIAFEDAANKFKGTVQMGCTYKIQGGILLKADSKYKNTNSKYKIKLDSISKITQLTMPTAPIPSITTLPDDDANYITIKECCENDGKLVNVIGKIIKIGEIVEIKTKKGDILEKREVTIIDHNNQVAYVTLWKDQINYPFTLYSIVGFQQVFVKLYKSNPQLSVKGSSKIIINPDHPIATLIVASDSYRKPIANRDSNLRRASISELHSIGLLDEESKSQFKIVAEFDEIIRKMVYLSCPYCMKKVIPDCSVYRCEKCNKVVKQVPKCVLNIKINDFTGELDLTMFGNIAEEFLNTKAEELYKLIEMKKDEDIANKANIQKYKPIEFHVCIKRKLGSMERFDQQSFNCLKFTEVDYLSECHDLIKNIEMIVGPSQSNALINT